MQLKSQNLDSNGFCRGCKSAHLFEIYDFGQQCLANDLRQKASVKNDTFPLRLVLCESCGLTQIDFDVPPNRLFQNYIYFSSFSETMREHIAVLVTDTIAAQCLDKNSLVIEAASNDGYLLLNYKAKGIPVLGIEPATNVAKVAQEKNGIPTINRFFCDDLGSELAASGQKCDVFHAHNVFAHVPDPADFLRGVSKCLKDDGIVIIEAPYVVDLVNKCEFDTIYHEHYSYFSISAIDQLSHQNGLTLINAVRVPIHGGSVRYFLSLPCNQNLAMQKILKSERELGIGKRDYYEAFAANVKILLEQVKIKITDIVKRGESIAIYGASAKGSTFLQSLGFEFYGCFDFAVDISHYKQEMFLPGTNIKILDPDQLCAKMPNYTLLLSWNFADEIIAQQQEYLNRGGKFIIPLPELKIVGF